MNIIFIAPPAAGKGTLSFALSRDYGYKHISTGDLLREEIKSGSKLGTEIQNIISKGELVSDEIITTMLSNELSKNSNQKFILDGYPRNQKQAEIITELFSKLNIDDYVVIYLDIDKEEAMKRALGRVVCSQCGRTYNIYFNKLMPTQEGKCDDCGATLSGRSDDTEETFNKRFETYVSETSPILNYFKSINKLQIVKVEEDSEGTLANVKEVIGAKNDNN